jgi:choline dehydrogenase-like flavoprotein
MNVDPDCGVVDADCRVHGTTNVLVTDASVFPSCIRVNAQLTTMAMAHYATARSDPFAVSA